MELSIGLLLLLCLIAGKCCDFLHLPRLIGYLGAGIVLGPAVFNLLCDPFLELSGFLRKAALIIILCRAGLGLDLQTLKKNGLSSALLCFLPAVFEIGGYLCLSFLLDLSLLEAAILGAVMAAVSPAVIVPRMLKIIEKNGKGKSIAQCIMAGASMDDIFVITVFSCLVSLYTPGDQVFSWMSLLDLPISIFTGAAAGYVAGRAVLKLNRFKEMDSKVLSVLILGISFLFVWMEDAFEKTFAFGSLIAVLVLCLMLKDVPQKEKIRSDFSGLWFVGEMFLFALVGVFVDFQSFAAQSYLILPVIAAALLFRSAGVWVSLLPSRFDRKEKLFCVIAYLPKATVQAAIGALPLSYGLGCGQLIFNFACTAIVLTAPVGAFLIDRTSSRLLR